MEDQKIVELFFERSEQAIDELAKKYGRACMTMATNILSDRRDAEECINDAYLGVWNTVPPQRPAPLLSYLLRILRNLAVNRYHANTAAKRNSSYDVALEELENCLSGGTSAEDALDARELGRMINRFLAGVDADSRVLFLRRYYWADSIPVLARHFHTSSHNISVRLSRLRGKLKKYLIQEGVLL